MSRYKYDNGNKYYREKIESIISKEGEKNIAEHLEIIYKEYPSKSIKLCDKFTFVENIIAKEFDVDIDIFKNRRGRLHYTKEIVAFNMLCFILYNICKYSSTFVCQRYNKSYNTIIRNSKKILFLDKNDFDDNILINIREHLKSKYFEYYK